MKQLFLSVSDGSVSLEETPAPAVRDHTVIIETLYSVISAGTERTLASFGGKNLIQKALERPDQVKKVTEKMSTDGILTTVSAAFGRLKDPMPMGYTAVGRVKETGAGVTELSAGDLVAAVGQAYHSEVNRVGKNLAGGIALEGIHQAEIIPGETVAVIGLGLLGHITARILDAYGCGVIGFDVADKTLPDTRLMAFLNSRDDKAPELARSLTRGRGVDKVIITAATDSNAPVELAQQITRDRGTICMIGVTKMELDRRPFYEKELSFKIARSYGPGRYDSSYEENGTDYPLGYVRFTEGRNVEEFLRLLAEKRLELSDLITHVVPFSQAADAYEMITKNPQKETYLGVLLEYGPDEAKWDCVVKNQAFLAAGKKKTGKKQMNLGLIGAGLFARTTMLPVMRESGLYHFTGLAATGGIATAQANRMFPFAYTASDYRRLLEDPEIDLIAISTQHNSHAKFIVEAMEAGKHVYVEKPLCLTLEELDQIEEAYEKNDAELFCGLNRRHAPLIRQIRKELKTDRIPAVYEYVVNAGYIAPEHWTQDAKKGGGRIIGEAVHFIDTLQSLDGSRLAGLDVLFAHNDAYPKKDNAVITLQFQSGAAGSILYTSMGSKKYPKEQLRVFSSGAVYELDNYAGLQKYGTSRHGTVRMKQDKGILAQYRYIYDVLRGKKQNRAVWDAFVSHRMLLEQISAKHAKQFK